MMQHHSRVVIIGGGIGGLTAAIALRHFEIPFDLYEQAPLLTEAGAGIGLSKAVLELFDLLDLGSEVREAGVPIQYACLADKNLNTRRKLPVQYETICIHRAHLVEILQNHIPAERIHLSKEAVDISSGQDEATVRFADGSGVTSDCVIAADGIHSTIRSRLYPGITPRYIDQAIWRGVAETDVPDRMHESIVEVWDEGLRFLTVPYNSAETFWLAIKPAPPGDSDNPDTVREDLLRLFSNFHPVFRNLIRHSRTFLRNDMADLGTGDRPWHHNCVVFIGDAIHATTPNLAQGGCQAIEDAFCLARCLRNCEQDVQQAFETYHRLRKKKVNFIVRTSWNVGVAAHSRNPLKHHFYRALLEYAPASFFALQERRLNDLSYLEKIG